MTDSPTEQCHAPAPAEAAAPAEPPAEAAVIRRTSTWRRAASSLLGTAALGSAAGVPF